MDSADSAVVVYGASGFTGRLIAEHLRDLGVPFVAAGRDRRRLELAMRDVPGIATASYRVAEVDHSADALTRLFTGARVVCNTVGPFHRLAAPVAEAALRAGCHYIDTAGEQGWIRTCDERFGAEFARAGLLLAPSTASLHVVDDIAARLCIAADPAVDSLDFLSVLNGAPSAASTQSIFDVLRYPALYLEQGAYAEWPAATAYEVVAPGFHQTLLAAPWGGGPLPVWYRSHPRVATVRSLVAWQNRGLVQGVIAMARQLAADLDGKAEADKIRILSETAESIQRGMPPRENVQVNRFSASCIARGSTSTVRSEILGSCVYRQTGVLQAAAARHLLRTAPHRVGFASPCDAFGHRELLAALRGYGLVAARIDPGGSTGCA